ncbi:pyrroloquinoline quinone biosynthesis protein PqqF [Pseudomonas sp. BBP2017]|uniref:pyrroloquinoline quinone biosynthesis protein PqqF n=1 Tax=Pseudomonas sp. BBP2017 TaxID=2109731 RepID=UPI000D125D70|nr:pyrroloquinoline quinone biosynthesis protein PqqF [Pseudomonas sp. BBP2017]PSS53826.1 pyrroloquinoline quinone biosynthesis protein PqqF [Pseudomonas sp. BBP2017]
MPSTVQHLTLDNGLQVILRHAPQLKRCAAAVRVMAGSHDAPHTYAGLAHFLEHLLFLGTERFPLGDGLMRYVQRHGGQVNASTRERSTDYFFEVPQAAFAGGLERLCDMLARPDFDQQRQLRERDVIHAEFIAWSRNPQAQAQFALLQKVSKQHPLSGFQAGNRYSLPVHSRDFQVTLQGYHQRYYQAGQMLLSLSGPQSFEVLQALARSAASCIATGAKIEQAVPVRLADASLAAQLSGQHLDVLQAVEQQPAGMEQAIDFLRTWLTDARPGGPLATLRQRGWLRSLEFSPLYSFAGQALLHTRLQLNDTAVADQAQGLLQGWLRFFRDVDRSALYQEYARLQQCRAQAATALDLACRDSAGRPYEALSNEARHALNSLLDSLLQDTSLSCAQPWHLPAPESLLNVTVADDTSVPAPTGLICNPILPPVRQQGVVYLRWQLNAAAHDRLWQVLDRALQPLRERATRVGVALQFECCNEFWQMRCAGVPETVVSVTREALEILQHPGASSWAEKPADEADNMPIRALLRQLPEQLVGRTDTPLSDHAPNQADLQALWEQARWQAMATGFGECSQSALNRTLQQVPGLAGKHRPVAAQAVCRWQTLPPVASEQALLLFCPVANTDEASARLLAQQIQGPFYQRLRVELQLGYAVFSAFRQLQGCSGLLFGIQSPNASHEQILSHIHEFLAHLPSTLSCSLEVRQALAEQLSEASMSNSDVAEWAWQAQLAERSQARLDDLQAAILRVDDAMLRQCAADLLHARQGWLCLANGPAPQGGSWTTGRSLPDM